MSKGSNYQQLAEGTQEYYDAWQEGYKAGADKPTSAYEAKNNAYLAGRQYAQAEYSSYRGKVSEKFGNKPTQPTQETKKVFQGPVQPGVNEAVFRETGKQEKYIQGPVRPSDNLDKFRNTGESTGFSTPQTTQPIIKSGVNPFTGEPTKTNPFTESSFNQGTTSQQISTEQKTNQNIDIRTGKPFGVVSTFEEPSGFLENSMYKIGRFQESMTTKGQLGKKNTGFDEFSSFGLSAVVTPLIGIGLLIKSFVNDPLTTLKSIPSGVKLSAEQFGSDVKFNPSAALGTAVSFYLSAKVPKATSLGISKVETGLGLPKFNTKFISEVNAENIIGDTTQTITKTGAYTTREGLFTTKRFVTGSVTDTRTILNDVSGMTEFKSGTIGIQKEITIDLITGKPIYGFGKKFGSVSLGEAKDSIVNIPQLSSVDLTITKPIEGFVFRGSSKSKIIGKEQSNSIFMGGGFPVGEEKVFSFSKSVPVGFKNDIVSIKSGNSFSSGLTKLKPKDNFLNDLASFGTPQGFVKRASPKSLVIESSLKQLVESISEKQIQAQRITATTNFEKTLISSNTLSKTNVKQEQKMSSSLRTSDLTLNQQSTKQNSGLGIDLGLVSKQDNFLSSIPPVVSSLSSNSRTALDLGLGLAQQQKEMQKMISIPAFKTPTTNRINPFVDSSFFPGVQNSFSLFDIENKSKYKKKKKIKSYYMPNLAAVGLNIKSTKIPTSYKLGAGAIAIRPLIFGSKRKRRSKK